MLNFFSRRTRLAIAWFAFSIHVIALAAMLFVLQFGLLLGTTASRLAFITTHVLFWQIGWLGWMLATLSLVLIFLASADVLAHKAWGIFAVALCLAGATIDWLNETILIGVIPSLAARAVADSFWLNIFSLWEQYYRVVSIGLANGLYTVGGIILGALAFKTRAFPRWLAWLAVPMWSCSIALSAFGLANDVVGITLASALIFLIFLPWLLLLAYGWLQKSAEAEFPPARVSFVNTLRSMIPKHPLPMTTVFRECFLVNFAVSPIVLRPLIPAPLELELHDGCAYLSIVLAEMDRMRPAFVPEQFGVTYNQVVYRVVVNYRGERGVYFLRSDASDRRMSIGGELLTFFHFNYSKIKFTRIADTLYFDLDATTRDHADIHAAYQMDSARRMLPRGSHFDSLEHAQEFLVQLFAAFSYDALTDNLGIVRIRRGEWDIRVVDDASAQYALMQDSKIFPRGAAQLDSIFYVKELPYYWNTLQVEPNQVTHRMIESDGAATVSQSAL